MHGFGGAVAAKPARGWPLELITLLRSDGLDSAADELCMRMAREFDPVISGAAAHALRYLRPLMAENVFEVFANRMANEGPILPVAEADDVAECFTEMQMMGNRRVYLQRVRKFRAAEGN